MATLWIIDGYNFIRQSNRFSEAEAHHHEKGKAAALKWLGTFAEKTGQKLCVVFDAYSGLHRNPIEENSFGIQIMQSRGAYTADEEIIALAKEKGEACVVISSDRKVQELSIRAGASMLSSQEFEREVGKILDRYDEYKEDEGDYPTTKSTKGRAFQPPKEKKKAYNLLRKFQ